MSPDPRPRYADFIPYATPDSLDQLRGPTSGTIRVSSHICTAPEPVYNLDTVAGLWTAYSAIVRDGLAAEQVDLLDRSELIRLWPDLNLPKRCRDLWAAKFPELRSLPVRALCV